MTGSLIYTHNTYLDECCFPYSTSLTFSLNDNNSLKPFQFFFTNYFPHVICKWKSIIMTLTIILFTTISLKSGNVNPPTFFFLFPFSFLFFFGGGEEAILSPLHLHVNFRIRLSISYFLINKRGKKSHWDFEWDCSESIDQFEETSH